MLWQIGNTTVRTPYRLREALHSLQGSPLHGNLIGRENEDAFATLLHDDGVVHAPRVEQGEDSSDLGRKWRSALSQLGFITHKLTNNLQAATDPRLLPCIEGMPELSGRPYEITPNGYRLLRADTVPGQQECFLRSLAAYRIPSVIERRYRCSEFSPLQFVLDVVHELEQQGNERFISFQEMALFVQQGTPDEGADIVATMIAQYRVDRTAAAGQVRQFDRIAYENAVLREDPDVSSTRIPSKARTLDDYADLTFRYLKATGLFRAQGRGIVLTPARAQLADLIRQVPLEPVDEYDYLRRLWQGAELPTDDRVAAITVINDLAAQIQGRGGVIEVPSLTQMVPADLTDQRHQLEQLLFFMDEEEFANRQADALEEIARWMDIIPKQGQATLPSGERISVPKGEAPAYLEWIIWRAFLAINSLENAPWEARRFQVDQDFLPVSHAPGGGPDMSFEFADAIVVVEVTLTSSSRQEAAEGEPVRRHVAQYVENNLGGKDVYGLFIAVDINSNTAHTFRSGDWYLADDSKINLQVVPMTLGDFRTLFLSGQGRLDQMPGVLQGLLLRCRARANEEAPIWKRTIGEITAQTALQGSSSE